MEQNQRDGSVPRGQNQLHLLGQDSAGAAEVVLPLLDRLEGAAAGVQLLVVTPDADLAAGVARRLAAASGTTRVMAVTDARRAKRLLRNPPPVLLGPPDVLLELINSATLKLDAVQVAVLAWLDQLDERQAASVEAVLSGVPKTASRTVLAAAISPGVEGLVERYAWRARHMQVSPTEPLPPLSLSYVVTSEAGRADALRRTLDVLDPESAFVVVSEAESLPSVQVLLRSLGYGNGSAPVRAGTAPDGSVQVVVWYDLPRRADELRAVGRDHPGARLVALVAPRQLASLRAFAGGSLAPLTLPEAALRARSREERLRDSLRAELEAGRFSRELLTLEPLLGDFDGIEIAAAALRLLEGERAARSAPPLQAEPDRVTRLFLNVGSTDDVRAGDLVGAIVNETGIARAELGRVDVRERHSTVEVATSVANAVVSRLTGVQIRGRRVIAKVDEDRPRERPHRAGGARGERRNGPRASSQDRARPRRPPRGDRRDNP